MWRGLASLLAKLAARNKKLTRLYRGDTLYPEKKLISTTGEGIGERPGSWFGPNAKGAEAYAHRPSKSYQDESGRAFLMGFNPDNPGVVRRVDLDLGYYGNKYRQKVPSKRTPSGFEHTPFYNLPEEEAGKGVVSLIHTLKNMYKDPLFKNREMIKVILNILKSGEKIRPFNRGGLASFVL